MSGDRTEQSRELSSFIDALNVGLEAEGAPGHADIVRRLQKRARIAQEGSIPPLPALPLLRPHRGRTWWTGRAAALALLLALTLPLGNLLVTGHRAAPAPTVRGLVRLAVMRFVRREAAILDWKVDRAGLGSVTSVRHGSDITSELIVTVREQLNFRSPDDSPVVKAGRMFLRQVKGLNAGQVTAVKYQIGAWRILTQNQMKTPIDTNEIIRVTLSLTARGVPRPHTLRVYVQGPVSGYIPAEKYLASLTTHRQAEQMIIASLDQSVGIYPSFEGTAAPSSACVATAKTPAAFGDAKTQDCWLGTIARRPFRLTLYGGATHQGYELLTGGRAYDFIGTPVTIYRFSGDYACWSTQAGAMGGAVDLRTGNTVSNSASAFVAYCGSAAGIRYVQGVPGHVRVGSGP